ncbi:MAG: hypothetical protein ACRC1K_04845, partial [Planctomycetia bacterium]
DPCEAPNVLPGSDIVEPGDCEFYLLGRLESHCPVDFRSPIRTDAGRIEQYKKQLSAPLLGPVGYSEGP